MPLSAFTMIGRHIDAKSKARWYRDWLPVVFVVCDKFGIEVSPVGCVRPGEEFVVSGGQAMNGTLALFCAAACSIAMQSSRVSAYALRIETFVRDFRPAVMKAFDGSKEYGGIGIEARKGIPQFQVALEALRPEYTQT